LVLFVFWLKADWKNIGISSIVTLLYTLSVIVEILLLGLPESPMGRKINPGKGMMVDIVPFLAPYVYIGIRIVLVLPVAATTLAGHKLGKAEKVEKLKGNTSS